MWNLRAQLMAANFVVNFFPSCSPFLLWFHSFLMNVILFVHYSLYSVYDPIVWRFTEDEILWVLIIEFDVIFLVGYCIYTTSGCELIWLYVYLCVYELNYKKGACVWLVNWRLGSRIGDRGCLLGRCLLWCPSWL